MVGHIQSLVMAVTPVGVSTPKQHVVDTCEVPASDGSNSEAEDVSALPRAQPPSSPSPALWAPASSSLAFPVVPRQGPPQGTAPSRGRGFSSSCTVVGVPASGSALLMTAPTRSRRGTRSWCSSPKDGRLWFIPTLLGLGLLAGALIRSRIHELL